MEADEEGLRTLIAAGIDPSGMVSFFETLQQKEGRESRYLAYLSSHPNTLERIDRLKSLIAQTPHTRTKPLAPETLTELKTICPARPAGNEKTRTN
jgi:predicted Zn-dependent protease